MLAGTLDIGRRPWTATSSLLGGVGSDADHVAGADRRPRAGRTGRRAAHALAELRRAAQRSATDGILFHQAVADRLGLHVTDLRCLNVLNEAGPLTAGELGQQLGLGTTGAVTRMVDRLERAGYVRREADPRDRRRVIVRPVPKRLAAVAPHYRGMSAAWSELLAGYGDEQLSLFLDLFDRMHQMSQRQLAGLQDQAPGPRTAP